MVELGLEGHLEVVEGVRKLDASADEVDGQGIEAAPTPSRDIVVPRIVTTGDFSSAPGVLGTFAAVDEELETD